MYPLRQRQTKNKQEKPKWFTGSWYLTGDTVKNPFSGETYELTGPELSMYDFIQGAQYTVEMYMQKTGEFYVEDPVITNPLIFNLLSKSESAIQDPIL